MKTKSQKSELAPVGASLDGFEKFFAKGNEKPLYAQPELTKVAVGILTWPIAQLSKPDRFKKHIIRKLIGSGETTAAIEWEVTPDSKLGMPTMLSLRLLFAFCKLATEYKKQIGTRPEWVPIPSWNQLCVMLGIEATGGNRKLLKHHLDVLHSTLASSKKAFKTAAKAEGISDKFILIPTVKFKGDLDGNGIPNDQTWIVLAKPLLDSIDSDYVKTIDLAFMAELDNETAQLLYTKISYLLNKALEQGRDYEDIEYDWLVESMGLTVCNEKWQAKKQLSPGFHALAKSFYIESPQWWIDGAWKIRVRRGIRFEYGEQHQLQIRKAAVRMSKAKIGNSIVPVQAPNAEDERNAVLARQAARILSRRKAQIDLTALAIHGWTLADAELKAAELKTAKNEGGQ